MPETETLISSYGFKFCTKCKKRFNCIFTAAAGRKNLKEIIMGLSEHAPLMSTFRDIRDRYKCQKGLKDKGALSRTGTLFANKIRERIWTVKE